MSEHACAFYGHILAIVHGGVVYGPHNSKNYIILKFSLFSVYNEPSCTARFASGTERRQEITLHQEHTFQNVIFMLLCHFAIRRKVALDKNRYGMWNRTAHTSFNRHPFYATQLNGSACVAGETVMKHRWYFDRHKHCEKLVSLVSDFGQKWLLNDCRVQPDESKEWCKASPKCGFKRNSWSYVKRELHVPRLDWDSLSTTETHWAQPRLTNVRFNEIL